jgi:dihydrofolate reductase
VARLIYSVTMSVDGYIAGPGGDMSWMTPYLGPNPYVDELIGEIGALLVGRRTFGGDDPHRGDPEREGKAFGGGWEGPQVVVTHHPPPDQVPGVSFIDDLPTAIAAARQGAGEKYVNVLGASVARQCLELGELDEVLTLLAPVLLGDGTRLFEHDGGSPVRLERIHESSAPLATNLRYRVVR